MLIKRQSALAVLVSGALCGCSSAQPPTSSATVNSQPRTAAPAAAGSAAVQPDATSAKSEPAKTTSARTEKSDHVPTENELKLAALHVKQVWQRQIPAESLNEFERRTYADVYYRKLPPERQRNWERFLSQPSAETRSARVLVPVSLPAMPAADLPKR